MESHNVKRLGIMIALLSLLEGCLPLTAPCIDPDDVPTVTYRPSDITEMSRYILPIGNDIVPGWGTLYKVEPQLININYTVEYRLGSEQDYKTRNFPSSSEPISVGTTCPWYFVKNIDDNRIPRVLYETKCVLRKSIGKPSHNCHDVYTYTNVVRRIRCSNGVYEYSTIVEPIAIGCTAVRRPRTIGRALMRN